MSTPLPRASVLWTELAGNSVAIVQMSRKSYQTVNMFAHIGQIAKLPYRLPKFQDGHKKSLRASVQRDGFDYRKSVLTDTLRAILDGNYTAVEALSVDGELNQH